jgi:hypothetical protein
VLHPDKFFKFYWLEPVRLLGKCRLHSIDIQNLFCQVDKYSRKKHPEVLTTKEREKASEAARENKTFAPRIKQTFNATAPLPAPFFPPKWRL